MMGVNETVLEFSTFGFLAISLVENFAFNTGAKRLADKHRGWLRYFFLFVALLGAETVLFSWLPGKAGCEISMLDGACVFEDGVYIGNFGMMLVVQALLIGIAFLKYLFFSIRGRQRLSGRLILANLIFCAGFAAAGLRLINDRRVFRLPGSAASGEAVIYGITALGAGLMLWLLADSFVTRFRRKANSSVTG